MLLNCFKNFCMTSFSWPIEVKRSFSLAICLFVRVIFVLYFRRDWCNNIIRYVHFIDLL